MDKKYWSNRIINQKPYTPGEFPNRKVIKLNTNENPYPPSQHAIKAAKDAANEDLRLYPDPNCKSLKAAIAGVYNLKPENVFVGNGSDEILAFSFLAFFEEGRQIYSTDVTYSFYPVYAKLFGVEYIEIPLNDDWTIPVDELCRNIAPVLLTNPNAPTGIALPVGDVERIVSSNPDYLALVDEAYVDFGMESAVALTKQYPNLLVCNTFSKSRSLAGSRLGFALGNESLISALECVKHSFNSYTLDRVALAAAEAAVLDAGYYEKTRNIVINTRQRTAVELSQLGFEVLPSSANFIFISHERIPAKYIFEKLSESGILVRHWDKPRIANFLRVSIGTDNEMDIFIKAITEIVNGG